MTEFYFPINNLGLLRWFSNYYRILEITPEPLLHNPSHGGSFKHSFQQRFVTLLFSNGSTHIRHQTIYVFRDKFWSQSFPIKRFPYCTRRQFLQTQSSYLISLSFNDGTWKHQQVLFSWHSKGFPHLVHVFCNGWITPLWKFSNFYL